MVAWGKRALPQYKYVNHAMKIYTIPAPPLSRCHTCGNEQEEEDGDAVF